MSILIFYLKVIKNSDLKQLLPLLFNNNIGPYNPMPLNKLENFVKNTEGRILYVNPNDLDSTDAITNQGNSLTQPFKTIQRALLESARFSYLKGNNNDIVEKTTILVYPGDHIIDNRPGFAIKSNNSNQAIAVSPSGGESNEPDV